MQRLRQENRNSPQYFNEHILERVKREKTLNTFDDARWKEMTKYFKGGKFLDLGVGDSPVCIDLLRKYPKSEFYALDFAEEIIEFLKGIYAKINYVCADALNTPYEDNFFDYIIAGELIEHMDKPEDLLKEVFRILKPGGVFSLSTPYKENMTREGAVDFTHMWSFDEEDIQDLMKPYGKVETFIFTKERYPKIIGYCWKK